jgi:MFS family permease
MRPIAIGCGLMIALGLVVTSSGGLHQLCACNLVLLGLIGGAGMFSPTIAYVTRWFDPRRDPAVALVSSGNTSPTRFGRGSCRSASTAMAGAER